MSENNRIAVCLHLYYAEQLPDMLKYLRNLRQSGVPYDLYVSLPEPREEIEQALRAAEPAVEIWHPANRGYDIGPFIDFLHKIDLAKYAFILKIHTKNQNQGNYTILNGNRMDNLLWGRVLLEALLGTPERIRQNFRRMEQNQNIGMLGSKYCLTAEKQAYASLQQRLSDELATLGYPEETKIKFIAGTMFMACTEVLRPFLRYTLADFPATDGKIKEGTFAHVMERLFGALVIAQGREIHGVSHNGYGIKFLAAALRRFLFQTKTTKSGKKIVKICKLPVYCREIK